jgi:hypothetical protein
LLCERVIKDAFTGTITIVGVLSRVGVDGFPGHASPFFVFAQLEGGLGHHQLSISVTDSSSKQVIARSGAMGVNFENVGEVRDMIFQIPPVPVGHAGSYKVAVLANGEEIAKQFFDTPPEVTT